jgi:hypothetical protein
VGTVLLRHYHHPSLLFSFQHLFLVIKTTEKNVDWLIRHVGLDDEYSNVPTLMVAIV